MIYHIVQNGGYILLILCLLISITNSILLENTYTIQEFCSANLYIHNIEPGEPYTLTIKTNVSSIIVNKWHKSKRKCLQEFKTSDSAAHFVVSIDNMSIPSCTNCRCNYFEISVVGHTKRYCGNIEDLAQKNFHSKSDKISVEFHPSSTSAFDVTLTFSVERNVYFITGTPQSLSESSTFIETPYFPTPYPPNYKAEYILQSDDGSYVSLLFLDFQISHQSFIEISGNNGTHPTRFYGNVFRPPVIVSQLNCLNLRFVSNDDQASMPGFRAVLSFIKKADSLVIPYTDCSGSKGSRGGYMSIKVHEKFGLYDCVWHIMPLFPFTISSRSVFIQLKNVGHKSSLEFRSGHNSKSEIVKQINCDKQNCETLSTEITVPASKNVYIRFSGYLDADSVVNISYSTYHTGICSNKEFKCEDGRCLLSDFRCDGIKQCPNGTDEELCPSANVSEVSFHPSVPSESIHYGNVDETLTTVVIIGIFGLLAVFISVGIFIYNYYRQNGTIARQSVGEMPAAVSSTLHPVQTCDSDNPPSYEDFVKHSDCFPPPPLYKRGGCRECTTSFCAGARMHSADSFNLRRSGSENGDIFLNVTGDVPDPSPPPRRFNVEVIQNSLVFKKSENLKYHHSLDSKLNELVDQESSHFLLSITHPVCTLLSNQNPHLEVQTLPPNTEISAKSCDNCRSKMISLLHPDPNISLSKDRRFTWSFVPRSAFHSEILTVVKTRCFSEPCNGISVHCSFY